MAGSDQDRSGDPLTEVAINLHMFIIYARSFLDWVELLMPTEAEGFESVDGDRIEAFALKQSADVEAALLGFRNAVSAVEDHPIVWLLRAPRTAFGMGFGATLRGWGLEPSTDDSGELRYQLKPENLRRPLAIRPGDLARMNRALDRIESIALSRQIHIPGNLSRYAIVDRHIVRVADDCPVVIVHDDPASIVVDGVAHPIKGPSETAPQVVLYIRTLLANAPRRVSYKEAQRQHPGRFTINEKELRNRIPAPVQELLIKPERGYSIRARKS